MFVNNELNELNYLLEHVSTYLKKDERLITDFNGNELGEKQIIGQIDQYDVGKLAIVSFNEQEDRIVKRHFNNLVDNTAEVNNFLKFRAKSFVHSDLEASLKTLRNHRYLPIRKGVIKPSNEEKKAILRAASAKLRAAVRVE